MVSPPSRALGPRFRQSELARVGEMLVTPTSSVNGARGPCPFKGASLRFSYRIEEVGVLVEGVEGAVVLPPQGKYMGPAAWQPGPSLKTLHEYLSGHEQLRNWAWLQF
jgi:hypothetical protein